MLVCNCMEVEYDEIKDAVIKHGDNLDAIQEETEAGTVCECCLDSDCDMVDLPLKEAVKKAADEI